MKKFSEISKGLAGRYLKKVPASAAHAGDLTGTGGMGQAGASDAVKKDYEKKRQAGIKKFVNRHKGTAMAVDKLTGKAKVPAKEELKGDQHKLDHNKDGKITGDDFKGLRKKKKGDKQETGTMNPKIKEQTVRDRLMSIWEKAAHSPNQKDAEKIDQNLTGKGAKDMMNQPKKVDDTEELGHSDASKAGRAGPNGKARPNDQKTGDRQIVNRIAKAYKEMKNGNKSS